MVVRAVVNARVSDSSQNQFKVGEPWLTQQKRSEFVRALTPYNVLFIIHLLHANPFLFSNLLTTIGPITCSRTSNMGSICLGFGRILSVGSQTNRFVLTHGIMTYGALNAETEGGCHAADDRGANSFSGGAI